MTIAPFIPGVSAISTMAIGGGTGPTGLGYWSASSVWHPYEPVDEAKLEPYFPQEDTQLVESAKSSEIVSNYISRHYPLDQISVIFTFFNDPKDLANTALVCKRFYAASKNPGLWLNLLQKNLSNIKALTSSTISTEHQVKIVFQRIFGELKLISESESSIKTQYNKLTSPDGLLAQAEAFYKLLEKFSNDTPQINSSKLALIFDHSKLMHLQSSKGSLEEALSHISTIKQKTYAKYDDQEIFEALIQSVETKFTLPTQ